MQNQYQNQNEKPKNIPLSKWNEYYDFPSVGSLRQLVFHNTNKFKEKVIRKFGNGRQYIDVDAFFKWANSTENVS